MLDFTILLNDCVNLKQHSAVLSKYMNEFLYQYLKYLSLCFRFAKSGTLDSAAGLNQSKLLCHCICRGKWQTA